MQFIKSKIQGHQEEDLTRDEKTAVKMFHIYKIPYLPATGGVRVNVAAPVAPLSFFERPYE